MSVVTSVDSVVGASGVVIGELIAIIDDGRTPLVRWADQEGSAAIAARAIVDLHAGHIGKEVVLVFDRADATRPIILGVLRDGQGELPAAVAGHVEIGADGERLLVSAREQLVLRCGKASVTLTASGKVLIQGTYVSSQSSGVHRIKGAAVQLN